MTKDEVIEALIKEKYLFKRSEKYYFTTKLALNYKEGDQSPEDLLKKFVKDSKIPYRIKSNQGGFYFPATISIYAKKFFYHKFHSGEYKYEDMTTVTNRYYNTPNNMPVSLTRYFQEGLFEQLMEEYLQTGGVPDIQTNGRPIG